jgi:hypothetical protein
MKKSSIRRRKMTIVQEIIKRNNNLKLMDDEQFVVWGALYTEILDDLANNERSPDMINNGITHKFMDERFRQELFDVYWEDDYWNLRCCWIMLMYFVNKRKNEWKEVAACLKDIKGDSFGFCYRGTLFEAKFRAFIKDSFEELKIEDIDEDAPMFVNDFTIFRTLKQYNKPIGQDADERFVDFEIYDDPEDPIRVTKDFELAEQSDLVKRAIRWKKKQLDMLIKSPHWEPENEKEKDDNSARNN